MVQPTRRIPFALRQKVEQELVRLHENDITEPAQGPTLWLSPIVAFPKPNNPDKLRLCVDMRQANTAILRERHPQPTIEDLLNDLNGARYFSKLDLTAAYHQLELDEQSRYITTFTTHKGLFQYKRLNFGTSSASEIFQSTIQSAFNGISGCRNISDDLIIFGKTQIEHDQTLRTVLQVAKERNFEFDERQLEFFGYVFSRERISPSPSKVRAITKIPPATALFGRNIRTKLPQQEVSVNMRLVNKQINEADAETKLKSKDYADKRRGAKQPNFTVGDQVLVRQRKRNNLTSRFIHKPYEITDIKGTMITARRKEHQITRNCSHLKLFTSNSNSGNSSESDVSVEDAVVQRTGEVRIEIEEPAMEHEDGRRRYPQRRRYNPLRYRDEQYIT